MRNILSRVFRVLLFLVIAAVVVFCFAYFDVWNHAVNKWNETFPPDLPKQEAVSYETDRDKAWDNVEKMANQKHDTPSLDEDFIEKNFGADHTDELKRGVLAGQAQVTKDMEKESKEYRLAADMMNKAKMDLMTEDDLKTTYDKCEKALDALAKEKDLSKESLLDSYYDMDSAEYDAFVRKISKNLKNTNETMQK